MLLSCNHLFLSLSTYVLLASGAISLPTSFILTGDSTTAVGYGWGDGFCGSTISGLASSLELGTPCLNLAVSGSSTLSYIAQGYWQAALYNAAAEIAKGRRTLVTIQFGHNDRWVGTPDAMAQRLTAMVQQVKQIKAEPVLITSLIVRDFDTTGKKIIDDTILPYAAATIQVSINEKTHLLDLHAQSLKYSEAIGATASQKLDPPGDTTHLNSNGAVVFGRMVADLMNADFGLIGINLLPIVSNSELSYNISHGIPSY